MSATSASPHPAGAEIDLLIGRTINDRYRVVEVIGHGGMGRVYKALQSPLDRLVALKILGAGHERDPNFYKRFFLEASVTAKLTHPNTITLYDYGRTEDGIFFIAMEYLDGRTISQAMQQDGPLAQERVIHVAQQICRSLREAHALGIIHRDLKPANVMLLRQHDDHDFVKVLDFGLVKFFHGENTDSEITNAGTFMGSPHYIAPEQARNQNPDQRCDIYSTGVLLYHMLTGKVPFTAPNPVDIILKHLHEAPVPPRQLRPDLDVDQRLESIVLRCMAKERTERFQTMDELLVELKILRRQLTGSAGPLSAPPATPESLQPLALRPPPPPADALEERRPRLRFAALRELMDRLRALPYRLRALPYRLGKLPYRHRELPYRRRSLAAGIGIALLATIPVALWVRHHRRAQPQPDRAVATAAPVAVPPVPPPPPLYQPANAGVTMVTVTSTPTGAEVNDADGRTLGRTPMDLPVTTGKPLELVLKLDGYEPFPLAHGSVSGDRIALSATLKKEPSRAVPPPRPPPAQRSVGYKDDPY